MRPPRVERDAELASVAISDAARARARRPESREQELLTRLRDIDAAHTLASAAAQALDAVRPGLERLRDVIEVARTPDLRDEDRERLQELFDGIADALEEDAPGPLHLTIDGLDGFELRLRDHRPSAHGLLGLEVGEGDALGRIESALQAGVEDRARIESALGELEDAARRARIELDVRHEDADGIAARVGSGAGATAHHAIDAGRALQLLAP